MTTKYQGSGYLDRFGISDPNGNNFFDELYVDNINELSPGNGININNNLNLTVVGPNKALSTDSSSRVVGAALSDGQLLIGATGAGPSAANIASADSSVVITNGPSSIDLAVTASPSFTDITLENTSAQTPASGQAKIYRFSGDNDVYFRQNAITNWIFQNNSGGTEQARITTVGVTTPRAILSATNQQLVLGTTVTSVISAPAPAASRTYTLQDLGADANFIMSQGAQDINGVKTFANQVIIDESFDQLVLGSGGTRVILNAVAPSSFTRTYRMADIGGNADFVMTLGVQTIDSPKTFTSGLTAPTIALVANSNQITLGTTNVSTITNSPSSSYTLTIPDTAGPASFIMSEGPSTQQIDTPVQFPRIVSFGLSSNQMFIQTNFTGNTYTINYPGTPSVSTVVTYPDPAAATATMDYNEKNTTLSGAKTFSAVTTVSNTTQMTGASTGALLVSGGAYVAKDVRSDGQIYLANVTSPTSASGPACIGSINTSNTNGPQLVCFANNDAANGNKLSLLGPRYITYGSLTSVILTNAASFYKLPMSCGASGTVGNRWGAVSTTVGSGFGVFTCPVAGTYRIEASFNFPASGIATTWVFAIYKNPTFAAVDANGSYRLTAGTQLAQILPMPSSNVFTYQGCAFSIEDCAAATTICMAGYSNGTVGATTGSASTRVCIEAVY